MSKQSGRTAFPLYDKRTWIGTSLPRRRSRTSSRNQEQEHAPSSNEESGQSSTHDKPEVNFEENENQNGEQVIGEINRATQRANTVIMEVETSLPSTSSGLTDETSSSKSNRQLFDRNRRKDSEEDTSSDDSCGTVNAPEECSTSKKKEADVQVPAVGGHQEGRHQNPPRPLWTIESILRIPHGTRPKQDHKDMLVELRVNNEEAEEIQQQKKVLKYEMEAQEVTPAVEEQYRQPEEEGEEEAEKIQQEEEEKMEDETEAQETAAMEHYREPREEERSATADEEAAMNRAEAVETNHGRSATLRDQPSSSSGAAQRPMQNRPPKRKYKKRTNRTGFPRKRRPKPKRKNSPK